MSRGSGMGRNRFLMKDSELSEHTTSTTNQDLFFGMNGAALGSYRGWQGLPCHPGCRTVVFQYTLNKRRIRWAASGLPGAQGLYRAVQDQLRRLGLVQQQGQQGSAQVEVRHGTWQVGGACDGEVQKDN